MTDPTIETRGKTVQPPWRRLLLSWAFLTFWLGLMVPLVSGIYYGITKPIDFDPTLNQLRTDRLALAVRVGTASCSNDMGIQKSSFFGVNGDNANFDLARGAVWNGTLHEAHLATYVAWCRGAHLPTVFTICRTVKPDGETTYGASENGLKPIVRYLLYCSVLGGVALIFLEVVSIVDKRKKSRALN
jgi:hypothetical protein